MENEIICDYCGEIIPAEEVKNCLTGVNRYGDKIYVCREHADEYAFCKACGALEQVGEMYYCTDNEEYYCDDCYEDNLYYCEQCREYHKESLTPSYTINVGHCRETWCGDCAEEHAFYCNGCRENYSHDCFSVYVDRYGDTYCSDCYMEKCDKDYRIAQYHDAPPMIWFGKMKTQWKRKTLYNGKRVSIASDREMRGLGFELEVDNGKEFSDCIDDIESAVGNRVYFEEDGSLSDGGFEIISQPHTVEEFWATKDKWENMLESIKENGFRSHDAGTCGLHVHFSRTMFGKSEYAQTLAIAKIINFIENYKDDIKKISRREAMVHWCDFYGIGDKEKYMKIAKSRYNGRYYAVNTSNLYTIEFRLFRGTLNPKSFFATFDFLINIVKNARKITWKNVCDVSQWLHGMSEDTLDYIKSRHAFENCLAGEPTQDEENYIEEVA